MAACCQGLTLYALASTRSAIEVGGIGVGVLNLISKIKATTLTVVRRCAQCEYRVLSLAV